MATAQYFIIFAAALLAGGINSIAGGGALIAFPALLFMGLPPITANATTNTAMFLGTLASAGGYVDQIKPHRSIVVPLALICLVGSIIGAVLLLTTPENLFSKFVPFLILLAAVLFTFGPTLVKRTGVQSVPTALTMQAMIAQFAISVYGGYFGAGQGFAILALLTIIGFRSMHEMNGIKSFIAACTNGIAVIPFAIMGRIAWPQAAVMCVGAVLGGYVGARVAQRVNPGRVRYAVLILAYGMSAYFFYRYYLAPQS